MFIYKNYSNLFFSTLANVKLERKYLSCSIFPLYEKNKTLENKCNKELYTFFLRSFTKRSLKYFIFLEF